MSVLVLLIFASLAIATTFLVAFIWAVHSGQYDDTSTPSMRLLLDERPSRRNETDFPTQPDNEENP